MLLKIILVALFLWVVIGGIVAVLVCPLLKGTRRTPERTAGSEAPTFTRSFSRSPLDNLIPVEK